jgi:hypothetical protein
MISIWIIGRNIRFVHRLFGRKRFCILAGKPGDFGGYIIRYKCYQVKISFIGKGGIIKDSKGADDG